MFWTGFGSSLGFIVAMGILAYYDWFFSPSQIIREWGESATSFLSHGSGVGDVVFVSPAMGIFTCYASWLNFRIWALIVGFAASFILHQSYIREGVSSPNWVTYNGQLSAAGWLHGFYQGAVFSALIQFYFFTPHVDKRHALIVSGLLAAHMFTGVLCPALAGGKSLWDFPTWRTMCSGWALIAFGYWYVARFNG